MSEIRIDTPESVDIVFEPAGLGSRFLAALIDGVCQWLVGLVAFFAIGVYASSHPNLGRTMGTAAGLGLFAFLLLLFALLVFGYKLLLEAFWNGQTLGKRLVGIRVVQRSGMPVRFWQALVRNLLRVVDIMPTAYALGAVLVLVTQSKQRLGDLVAGTVVVQVKAAPAPVVVQQAGQVPGGDLTVLRERVQQLPDSSLAAARGLLQRRADFDPAARRRLASRIAAALVTALDWSEPLPADPEAFIEAVLYVRAH